MRFRSLWPGRAWARQSGENQPAQQAAPVLPQPPPGVYLWDIPIPIWWEIWWDMDMVGYMRS